MNQLEFENFLARNVSRPSTDATGRFVTNAFGIQERVVLPKCYWRYLDWAKDFDGVNVDAYIRDCDLERGELTLSHNLMEWVYFDMTERKANGDPLPPFVNID
jgi:hypothetical protein